MYYLIDYDRREVDAKHTDQAALSVYVEAADLELACCVVGSATDIQDSLSLEETRDVYENLTFDEIPSGADAEEAAERLWSALGGDYGIPEFTKTLGKRLVRAHGGGTAPTPDPTPTKPKTPSSDKPATTRKRHNKLEGTIFTIGLNNPPRGRHTRIVDFIHSNEGATYEELCELLAEDKGSPTVHIKHALTKGFIENA